MSGEQAITRRSFLRLAAAVGGAITLSPLLGGCGNRAPAASTAAPVLSPTADALLGGLQGLPIDDFFQDSYRRWAGRDPETLTTLGLADVYGAGDGNLTTISDPFIRQTQVLESGLLNLLRRYDRTSLTESQAVTADIYDWFLDDLVRGHAFMYDNYLVNPILTSVHYNLYMLFTTYQPLSSIQDANDYISRLSQLGMKLDQLIDGLQRREERGVILPAFFIPIVLADIDPLAKADPSSHPYCTSLTGRLKGVTGEQRQSLSALARSQVETTAIPAYGRFAAFLRRQQGKAPNQVGVWQFSDGKAYYAQSLRRHTTTEMTAEGIHDLGKQEVARIQQEMRKLAFTLGYASDESIPRLFERVTADSGAYHGQDAVKAYEDAIALAELILPKAFSTLPKAKVKVIGGRDGDYYMPASYDGSRPGLYFARTDISSPRFGFKTTAFHETVPGHHLQISLALEVPDLPDLRRGVQFNAYSEGWALYAERLMWEMGVYADDPLSDLGRLRMEAFRAARLVVDTGIHSMRWSFGQAVNYLVEAAGFPRGYAEGEITRYSVWPGQAASYYIGFLKLLEVRKKAEEALGSKFDLKDFHQVVLANGSVPLSVLEQLIGKYIESKR